LNKILKLKNKNLFAVLKNLKDQFEKECRGLFVIYEFFGVNVHFSKILEVNLKHIGGRNFKFLSFMFKIL
jgi:hypothetical protein